MRNGIEVIERQNRERLSKKRRKHIDRVRRTAAELAERFGIRPGPVDIAAVAHDMDRETPTGELLRMAKTNGLELVRSDLDNPVLLHGPVAAWRLENEFGVFDRDIIEAVRCHTFGHTGLGAVGHVIFAADYLEPGRAYLTDRERSAILMRATLAEVVCAVIDHNRARYGSLDSRTAAMYQELTESGTWRA